MERGKGSQVRLRAVRNQTFHRTLHWGRCASGPKKAAFCLLLGLNADRDAKMAYSSFTIAWSGPGY